MINIYIHRIVLLLGSMLCSTTASTVASLLTDPQPWTAYQLENVWGVYKDQIDSLRGALNNLAGRDDVYPLMKTAEMERLRKAVVSIADELLKPALFQYHQGPDDDVQTLMFYENMMGDLYRYRGENLAPEKEIPNPTNDDDYLNAEAFYKAALARIKALHDRSDKYLMTAPGLRLIGSLSVLLFNQPARRKEGYKVLSDAIDRILKLSGQSRMIPIPSALVLPISQYIRLRDKWKRIIGIPPPEDWVIV